MKRKVGIKANDKEGYIVWDTEDPADFEVFHPDDDIFEKVLDYLSTKQDYWIPESNRVDDYRIDEGLPTDSEMYFSLALSALMNHTGVWVEWGAYIDE